MKTLKTISIHLALVTFFALPIFTLATDGTYNPGPQLISNPIHCSSGQDCSTIMGVITLLLNNVVMPIAAVAVVMWIIWAGFSFVTAQGNPKKIEEAKSRLLWSLIGAGILLGAAGIAQVVRNTFNSLAPGV